MTALFNLWREATEQLKEADIPWLASIVPYRHLHPSIVPVPEANIATDLGPKLDPILKAGSRICVVGFDGGAVSSEGYPWAPMLASFVKRGVLVDYLLIAETLSPTAVACFAQIGNGQEAGQGKLRLFRPSQSSVSSRWKSCLVELKTFHFVVTDAPMTLWIETNHPSPAPKAYGCYFFPIDAAKETGLGSEYLERFDGIVTEACEQVDLTSTSLATNAPTVAVAAG